jgi:uncharacterized protein (TIGR03435 family)
MAAYSRWLSSGVAIVLLSSVIASPTAQTSKPIFEVVSVKKRDPARPQPIMQLLSNPSVRQNGRYYVPDATVASLIEDGYDVRDFQVIDGPDWMRKDLFEVNARAAGEASREQMRPMVQSLLEERFKLVVRKAQREMTYFELLPVRSDGVLGPNLQQRDDCRDPNTRPNRPRETPVGGIRTSGCGSMSVIAMLATRAVGVPVIDKTGLVGTFDFFLFASPDSVRDRSLPASPDGRAVDPNLPSFRDGLRDQLGLKLESARGPLEVLVIESVQQPTEN